MDAVISDVKYNCDVSDAHFWGNFSLCGLLMRMRSLYRDEHRLRPWEPINHEDILEWISVKEEYWSALQGQSCRPIQTSSSSWDPFDVTAINQELGASGLVYGAGYGLYMKPSFFIAELRSRTTVDGYTVYVAGREWARDIFTAAGMLQGTQIFIRLDVLKASLWDLFLQAQGKGAQSLTHAFLEFGISPEMKPDEAFDSKFDALTEHCARTVLLHERAEAREDVPEWPAVLSRCDDRKTESFLRQVKDALADSSDHGPLRDLIDSRDTAGLSLYLEALSAYHTRLCPEIRHAFADLLRTGDWEVLDSARREVHRRLTGVRDAIVSSHRTCSADDAFLADVKKIGKSLALEL